MQFLPSEALTRDLLSRLEPGPERGGVILRDGTIVEFTNHSEDGFVCDVAELIPVEDRLAATWHTHPDATAQLSGMDWASFVAWPNLLHMIIGTDGIRQYRTIGLGVVDA